jgi:hypothetical protein
MKLLHRKNIIAGYFEKLSAHVILEHMLVFVAVQKLKKHVSICHMKLLENLIIVDNFLKNKNT